MIDPRDQGTWLTRTGIAKILLAKADKLKDPAAAEAVRKDARVLIEQAERDDAYFEWAKSVIEANDRRDTPCKGVCNYSNEQDKCLTCHRNLSEITAWPNLTRSERRKMMQEIKARRDETT